MAEKKKSSNVQDQNSTHPMQTVYSLLRLMGIAQNIHDIQPNFQYKGGRVTIAVPRIHFALACDGDHIDPFIEEGWEIQRIRSSDIESFSRIFFAIMAGRLAEEKMKMDPTVKNTSEPEERLLNAIIWRGLPTPDRNKKFLREDGSELTVPDFTWEEYKLAFFMDGAYWHSVKDDTEMIKQLKTNAKKKNEVIAKRKDKVRKDAEIRSELAVLGYTVLVCTDADIETQEGIDTQIDRIEKVINRTKAAQEFVKASSRSNIDDVEDNASDDTILDLLSPTHSDSDDADNHETDNSTKEYPSEDNDSDTETASDDTVEDDSYAGDDILNLLGVGSDENKTEETIDDTQDSEYTILEGLSDEEEEWMKKEMQSEFLFDD